MLLRRALWAMRWETSSSRQPGGERAVESRLRERSGAADDWLVGDSDRKHLLQFVSRLFIFSGTTALLLTFTLLNLWVRGHCKLLAAS